MSDLIRKRLTGKEEGFTLIELLVVIVILGILMAIAVPSYMGFKDRANKTAAMANVRSAIPSVELYYQDNTANPSTYTGITTELVRDIDPGLASTVVINNGTADSYCISAEQGGYTAKTLGPGKPIEVGTDVSACAVVVP